LTPAGPFAFRTFIALTITSRRHCLLQQPHHWRTLSRSFQPPDQLAEDHMARFKDFTPAGVIPATLLAFKPDYEIDWAETTRHLKQVAATPGLSAITVNGHASEVHACTFDEQREILDRSLDDVGDRLPLIAGVFADGSHEAARIARMSTEAGASALLVFPSTVLMMGGERRPEMALAHFKAIADATDLPLICFNYARWTNLAYPLDTIVRMAEEIPSLAAIKDWTAEPMEHERNVRTLQSLPRPINVLSTNSAWLMQSLTTGCAGLLSGAGSIIADLQVALFQAIQKNDLARAREINDRMQPVTQAFYAAPFLDMHNRMKEAAVILGRQERAVVRPPLMKLPQSEIDRIAAGLKQARVGRDGAEDLDLAPIRGLAAE
jgi:4-hydroxy-tetrahydrodipicolinate synthase